GFLLHRGDDPTAFHAEDTCPHCRRPGALKDRRKADKWDIVLVQRLRDAEGQKKVVIDLPTKRDKNAAKVAKVELPESLKQEIPPGVETSRLARAGFKTWADLYPARQLRVLLFAA